MQVKDRERSNGTVQPVDMRPDWILEHTRLGVILQQWGGDLLLNLQYGSFLRLLIDAFGGHILLEDADRYSTKGPRESSVSRIDKLQL